MKKIGFIGAYDKTDLMLYVAKILATLKKKVLIVDNTITQKSRYIVPTMNPVVKYITDFENIDIAVGFTDEEDIKKYLGLTKEQDMEYEYMFVDVDSFEGFNKYNLKEANKNYFVTSFDNYSLKKGLEIFTDLKEPISLSKVLFAREILKEEDDYLNYLSSEYKIIWNDYKIYFPMENGDLSVIYENQRVAKIKFRRLSIQYKDGIQYIAEEILGNVEDSEVRRAMKLIERGV